MTASHLDELPAGHGVTVVIDDDEQICLALCDWLDLLDKPNRHYLSAEAFLADLVSDCEELSLRSPEAGRLRIAGAIIDMNLPGMNGMDLVQALQQREPLLPVVLITAAQADTQRPGGWHGKRLVCLNKPFSLDALEEALIGR